MVKIRGFGPYSFEYFIRLTFSGIDVIIRDETKLQSNFKKWTTLWGACNAIKSQSRRFPYVEKYKWNTGMSLLSQQQIPAYER
jgi:hypothetical protein